MKPMLCRALVAFLLCTFALTSASADNMDARGTDNVTEVSSASVSQKKAMIAAYHFNVKGKTSEMAIRSRIVPDGDEIFASERELAEALENKAQSLRNLRIFRSVTYRYWYTNESTAMQFFQVEFTIADGGSKLPLPYAKYDSNYGIKAGLRFYDKNLFGQMADLYFNADVEQNDNSFEKSTYFGELGINRIMFTRNIQMDIASSFNWDEDDPSDSSFELDIKTRGLKIDHKPLTIREWMEIAPQYENGYYKNSNSWKFEEIGNYLSFGPFGMALGGYTITNTIIDYHDKSSTADYERLQSSTSLAFHGFKLRGKQLDFNVSFDTTGSEDGVLDEIRIGETVGMNFTLFKWMNWYNSLSFFNTLYPKSGHNNSDGSHLLYEGSLYWYSSLSHSNINYVTDDFRKGLEFKLTYRGEQYLDDAHDGIKYVDYSYQNFAFQLTYFWFPAHWVNPSIRITGGVNNYSAPASNSDKIPNERYFYPDATGDTVPEYIRGVRDDNKYARTYKRANGDKIYDWEKAVVINLNLTTKFIRFGSFAHTLINPFVDVGIFKREASPAYSDYNHSGLDCVGDWECVWGVGMEGIGIIDSHPAYPIRLSIGINGGDIFHKLKGDLTGGIEYEIYFGMYHFF